MCWSADCPWTLLSVGIGLGLLIVGLRFFLADDEEGRFIARNISEIAGADHNTRGGLFRFFWLHQRRSQLRQQLFAPRRRQDFLWLLGGQGLQPFLTWLYAGC